MENHHIFLIVEIHFRLIHFLGIFQSVVLWGVNLEIAEGLPWLNESVWRYEDGSVGLRGVIPEGKKHTYNANLKRSTLQLVIYHGLTTQTLNVFGVFALSTFTPHADDAFEKRPF